MSRNTSETPKSYEDIVRKTVVDPDSSRRPTRKQEQAAREGFQARDGDEQELYDRLVSAIAATGASAAGVTIEVKRDLVILRGRVNNANMLRVLEDKVALIPGVTTIHNQIVVGAS